MNCFSFDITNHNTVDIDTIKQKIEQQIPDAQITLEGDGCSCQAVVVSDSFEGKATLARQRMVMACVDEQIKSGELHALALKTYTTAEWRRI